MMFSSKSETAMKIDINDISAVTTGHWTICFRKIGFADGPVMNAVCDAYGDTLKEALIYAKSRIANDVMVDWASPVTKVTYNGQINLLTSTFIEKVSSVVYDEDLFPRKN